MNTTTRKSRSVWGIQLNRQLREWNDNMTLELETRYALAGRHKLEHSRLHQKTTDLYERAALAKQQLQEIHELTQQHQATRIAILECHAQERTTFTEIMC